VGGLKYSIDPTKTIGNRITDMEINGKPLEASKKYRVAGWASVEPNREGRPIWDVVADYIRNQDAVKVNKMNVPKIKGIKNNPGLVEL
jgi:sulfur-oxidizing protein SoxB